MNDKIAELKEEQEYFDNALDWRERHRASLRRAPTAAAHAGAAVKIRETTEEYLGKLRGPEEAVAFGRIDNTDSESLYVGYNAVTDGEKNVVVVNWEAPAAEAFYRATHDDPLDLVRRRQFVCDANRIRDFDDVVFAELAREVADVSEPPVYSDALLSDLDRTRTGEMHDIVRTIQAAQYEIVRADIDQLLVVQGGAGTGKTAIGLHRIAWLLFNHRDTLTPEDVLVVGPSKPFVRYIQRLLPGLGYESMTQVDVSALGPNVRLDGSDAPEDAKLKGGLRMRELLRRALRARIDLGRVSDDLGVSSTRSTPTLEEIQEEVNKLGRLPYMEGRNQFRRWLRERMREEGSRTGLDLSESLLERIWPQETPQSFLNDLYGSVARLVEAAGDDFSAREASQLYRRAQDRVSEVAWTPADAPLLDFAERLIAGPPKQYGHIVVDEAQDLSPMQLISIGSRSRRGSMTVLGDLAQSTGHFARESWDEVMQHLRGDLPANLVELELGYRVPRQIFHLAAQVLAVAAPNVRPPKVVRDGPADPNLVHVQELNRAAAAVDAARTYSGMGCHVGVVVPEEAWDEVAEAFTAQGVRFGDASRDGISMPLSLVTPTDVKGLEFDAVVIVEPELIVKSAAHGDRLLYVALTRSTSYLTIVHVAEALPIRDANGPALVEDQHPGGHGPQDETASLERDRVGVGPTDLQDRIVARIAETVAQEIRSSVDVGLQVKVAKRIRELLEENDYDGGLL